MNRPNRRQVVHAGIVGALGASRVRTEGAAPVPGRPRPGNDVRGLFPRLAREAYLNAAAGTPRGAFADAGLALCEDLWRLGPEEGRGEAFSAALDEARARFARLIGATPEEVAFVPCTKEGEQIVLEGTPELWDRTGNVVTNDLHFSGSLHNLLGLRARRGLDVRVVRARDWAVAPEEMIAAMDGRTRLVSVTLVSNVNGHVEPVRELADAAHERGARLYADVIQAAGAVPLDVEALGVDYAACSGYKWLFGVHGAGFLYVRRELQGSVLQDRLVPGHARPNYPPWTEAPEEGVGDFRLAPLDDARRYQPGHPSYLGLCALNAGLGFLEGIGVEAARDHAVALNRRLLERLDLERFPSLSPHADRSPILTLRVPDDPGERLREAGVVATWSAGRLRVSPSVYNVEDDVDRLAAAL